MERGSVQPPQVFFSDRQMAIGMAMEAQQAEPFQIDCYPPAICLSLLRSDLCIHRAADRTIAWKNPFGAVV